jgi:hypothetical protein
MNFQDILAKLNEIPPEKPGSKRLESHSSTGIQQTTNTIENEWITDEFLTEFTRQKVYFSSFKTIIYCSVFFRRN